jgi:ABC-type multidrug transport system fused ATPase/permease subunit
VISTYRKLLDLMSVRERRTFYLLMVVIVVMGIAEMMSVASILPLMLVLRQPSVIDTNPVLAWLYSFGFTSHQNFQVFLAALVFLVVVGGMVLKAGGSYLTYRFTMMRAFSISSRLLSGYLSQPYTWFLNRHSSSLGSNVLGEVQKVVTMSLLPAMKFITYLVAALALVGLLLAIRPEVALFAAGVFGGIYGLLYFGVRKSLNRMGEERHRVNEQRFRIVTEAFGGMKDVKLLGLEGYFSNRFRGPAQRVAEYDGLSMIIREVPRYAIEALAFGGLLAFILYLLLTGDGSLGGVVPILTVYAFTAIRLFPALQRIYTSVGQMRFAEPSLTKLHRDFQEIGLKASELSTERETPLPLTRELVLRDVHFGYPQAERQALRGLTLTVPRHSRVGIVGGTGAGKTTVVDIMLGLLEPQEGLLLVDGTPITPENRRRWQRSIGYVPQQIFLTDDTVAANVAFGLKAADIDFAAVERASRTAELHDFVMREMPEGYQTRVGERGVRLSGGQRQRIGIARALYHDPDVLILDEATSALDNLTERAVMDAVHNLGSAKTIVMIAHRLSTVRDCDIIFMLEHGHVVAQGSYDDLIETNRQFRALAGA